MSQKVGFMLGFVLSLIVEPIICDDYCFLEILMVFMACEEDCAKLFNSSLSRSFTRKLRCLICQVDDFELKKKKQYEPCSVSSLIKWVVFYCSSNQEKGQKVKDNFHFFSLLQYNLVSERETKEPSVHDLLLSYLMLQSCDDEIDMSHAQQDAREIAISKSSATTANNTSGLLS